MEDLEHSKKKRIKVSFLGLFGLGNLGNESTLQAILFHLRQRLPDAEVICICTGPEDTATTHNISAVPMRGIFVKPELLRGHPLTRLFRRLIIGIPSELYRWFVAFRTLKGTDMLILPGTGFLSDGYTGPFGWPYEILKWSIVARLCRCKLLFVSVGVGPIFSPLSRSFIKFALSLATYRSYRDSSSKDYLKSINFCTENDPVYPDLAFSLPSGMVPESNHFNRKRPVIGVGLMSYAGEVSVTQRRHSIYPDYIRKLATFVTWLLQHKYGVRFLIGNVLYDNRVKQDINHLLEKRQFSYEEGQIIDEPISSVEQLLSQLAATDIVVTPRFHNILFALMLNKPALSLSYHEKNDSLMANVGLAEYCQNIEDFDVDRLTEQLIKLETNAESLRPYIRQKAEEFRRALDEQYTIIFNHSLTKR
jgi:polysaccharide pyruvyl transferase WcaK-like protein